jgi:hypothetical protein
MEKKSGLYTGQGVGIKLGSTHSNLYNSQNRKFDPFQLTDPFKCVTNYYVTNFKSVLKITNVLTLIGSDKCVSLNCIILCNFC